MSVRPAKTQISLRISPVWSESSLCAQWIAKDPGCLHTDSEDSNQAGRVPRLIWVFARRTLILLVLSCRGSTRDLVPWDFFTNIILLSYILCFEGNVINVTIWAASWQNQQCGCAPSEDSYQPWHSPSLIRAFAARMKKAWVLSYPLSAQRRLWSEWADAQTDLSLR